MIFEQKYSRIIFVIECHWGGVSNKRRVVNFYFNDIFIGDNNNEMDRFTAIKKKKVINLNIFFEIQTSISTFNLG